MNPYIIPGIMNSREKIVEDFKNIIKFMLSDSGITEDQLHGGFCNRGISDARMLCMWAMKRTTNCTWLQIGKYFNRDHSTAIHAFKTIEQRIKVRDDNIMRYEDKIKTYL